MFFFGWEQSGSGNFGYASALIAGGLMGYVFVWQLQKGNDWGQWMTNFVNWTDDLFNPKKTRTGTAFKAIVL
ncbi:MAG: hypothetical protein WKG06_33055 [Segetibacter sp.]